MYHKNKLAPIILNVLLIAFRRHIGEKEMREGPKLSNVSDWKNADSVQIWTLEHKTTFGGWYCHPEIESLCSLNWSYSHSLPAPVSEYFKVCARMPAWKWLW